LIVQGHGMNGIHVFWTCHSSLSPRMFFVFSAQMPGFKPSNPVLDCGVGRRALIT
jgi:hypothetical protein